MPHPRKAECPAVRGPLETDGPILVHKVYGQIDPCPGLTIRWANRHDPADVLAPFLGGCIAVDHPVPDAAYSHTNVLAVSYIGFAPNRASYRKTRATANLLLLITEQLEATSRGLA